MLGESLHITSKYLAHEAKIASAVSRVEALEAKNSKLKKDLISVMDEANTTKEKAKILGDDLRAKRQLTLEKDEQFQATKEKPRPLRLSSKLRSTTLYSSAGTTKVLSSFVCTWSNTPLE